MKWIISDETDYKDTELYYKREGKDVFIPNELDGKSWTWPILKNHLISMVRMGREDNDAEKVFLNPQLGPQEWQDHFKTRMPVYYNPD